MTFDELKDKALSLPLVPGVYIMRSKDGTVIYVGKAKKLKNRVSQYFQDTASHTPKTKIMVSKIDCFDVIIAASEFEALVLECSLIKRYLPKYNILLKDGKGYPYLRLDMKQLYPSVTMVGKLDDDGAEYFGPYGSRGVTQEMLAAIRTALKLPTCSRRFPEDIGKGRVCLNFHMNQCAGWCRGEKSPEEYRAVMQQARNLLKGDYRSVTEEIRTQMNAAAEDLNFELAANLRDRMKAVEVLGQKQLVTAGTSQDTDVIGYARNQAKACFAVLHFSNGNLIDKDYEVIPVPDNDELAVSSLIKQYYLNSGFAPKRILLPFPLEESGLIEQLIELQLGRKTGITVPQRGEKLRLVELAIKNAYEEADRITTKEEHTRGVMHLLEKMLAIPSVKRIESFDISNISGTDIVAGMVVFQDGKPKKSEYRRFKVNGLDGQDDYASMYQVITRRFSHYLAKDHGFQEKPDLLLIDGGIVHAQTAVRALSALELALPVFGMVKDDRHRTRALVTPEGDEIGIAAQQSVYALIGNIQEETHNYAISYHRKLRSNRLKHSELDRIQGIGPARKQALIKRFRSIAGISEASLELLEQVLPVAAARAVYHHFHEGKEE